MQHFESMHGFLTATEWSILSAGCCVNRAVDLVVNRAFMLSCRCPSEPTLKLFASLVIACTNDFDTALNLPPQSKSAIMAMVKSNIKAKARRANPIAEYVELLPADPNLLKEAFPEVYRHAYPAEEPVACNIELPNIIAIKGTFRCMGLRVICLSKHLG